MEHQPLLTCQACKVNKPKEQFNLRKRDDSFGKKGEPTSQPDEYEMDRQQLDVRPPTRSSAATYFMPQIEQDEQDEQAQFRVRNLEVGRTLRRGLEARQVSTTTRLVCGAN